MEKLEKVCNAQKVTKVIAGDYKKLSLVFGETTEKFSHLDKNEKLVENNIISINPNQIFIADVNCSDSQTLEIVEVLNMLSVGRQLKPFIMNALFLNSICTFDCLHVMQGETDPETGRTYSGEEYSYRLQTIEVQPLTGLKLKLILQAIENNSVVEEKPKPTISSLFGNNNTVIL